MINLQLADNDEDDKGTALCDQPSYPYGLTLTLDDDTIDLLGLKALPQVGQTMMMQARVAVCAVSQYESAASEKTRSVVLQVTDMELASDTKTDAATKLYAGGQ